jgi:hypothetical protein
LLPIKHLYFAFKDRAHGSSKTWGALVNAARPSP